MLIEIRETPFDPLAELSRYQAKPDLHGKAGDMIVCRKSQAGLVAGDLIEEIPYVFRDVTLR